MDSFRPQKSPGSDRFLGLLSTSPPSIPSASFEFDEHDIFSTDTDPIPIPNPRPHSPLNPSPSPSPSRSPLSPFYRDRSFGILAALPEDESRPPNPKFLQRQPSIPSSSSSAARVIPVIPKPRAPDYAAKTAPVNVPMVRSRLGPTAFPLENGNGVVEEDVEEEEEMMMLPPHEIVDRAQGNGEPMTTFSVLEGVGRTLKGRDLRRVRNAVWHKTGFLD